MTLSTIAQRSLRPEGQGMVRALSRIGYDLEDALADIVDNSIDAGASNVEIAFYRDKNTLNAVMISDDGAGMNFDTLCRGMQFAGRTDHAPEELGAYGLGMKSASLSQCRTMSVVTRQNNETVGARWSLEAIDSDWNCQILDPAECARAFDAYCFRSGAPDSGTLLVWERLERLGVDIDARALDRFLPQMIARLDTHLGLTFHRFIQNRGLAINLVVRDEQRSLVMPRKIVARDPFGYAIREDAPGPRTMRTHLPDVGNIELKCHIWPEASSSENFLLGSKRGVEFQGFYFYRNNRLIQSGGWNGVVRNEIDPELALARVSVELPPGGFKVDVLKSSLQVTASQASAFMLAQDGAGDLETYLDAARGRVRAHRRQTTEVARSIVVPGEGFPSAARRAASQALAGDKPTEEIDFVWEELDEDAVFKLDLTRRSIVLNRFYRSALTSGGAQSPVDAPIVKLLLFFLMQEDFERVRLSPQRHNELRAINARLLDLVGKRRT